MQVCSSSPFKIFSAEEHQTNLSPTANPDILAIVTRGTISARRQLPSPRTLHNAISEKSIVDLFSPLEAKARKMEWESFIANFNKRLESEDDHEDDHEDGHEDEDEDEDNFEDDDEPGYAADIRSVQTSKTIHFSLRGDYTDWSPREAFRELVQNW